jgi:adenine deaminase
LEEDLRQFRVLATWQDGREVARDGKSCCNAGSAERVNRFAPRLPDQTDFALPLESERIRVIEAVDGSLYTRSLSMPAMARDGLLQADIEHDVLWLAVVNRYRPQPPALAWVKGFALRQGAIASSVAHDSHNLIAVGTDPRWLLKALHLLMEARGGIAAAGEAGELCLPLPIAGLMSDRDGDWVAQRYTELNRLVAAMGCPLRAPFMTLSFMALLVIPELKLSDKGLFDVGAFAFTSMWPNAVNAG